MLLLLVALALACLLPLSSQAQSQKGVWDLRQQQASSGRASAPARDAAPEQARASGRGREFTETIKSGGIQRRYTIHVPPSYDGTRPLPAVLAFHGSGMDSRSMRGLTLMDLVADRNGFLAVYPEGAHGGWNAGGYKSKSTENDVLFTCDLLRDLQTKYRIDPRAVYACGISNGGQMVQKLACDIPEQIAAIGVVAITGYSSVCKSCTTRRNMPAMFFIGTEDPLCPRENGEAKQLGALGNALGLGDLSVTPQLAKIADIMTAEEIAEFWAQHNGAGVNPRQERLPDINTRDKCRAIKETYGGGDREVVVYTIEGGGHSWPGGLGFVVENKLGNTCMDINASELLWEFFKRHARR